MARVIADTGLLIGAARRQLDFASLVGRDDVAIPAVVLTEYLVGVELDPDPSRQAEQRAFLDALLPVMPIEDYTTKIVPHHVALLMHARTQGRPRGALDMIIAATARATGRTLLITDTRAGFDDLPGVDARVLSA